MRSNTRNVSYRLPRKLSTALIFYDEVGADHSGNDTRVASIILSHMSTATERDTWGGPIVELIIAKTVHGTYIRVCRNRKDPLTISFTLSSVKHNAKFPALSNALSQFSGTANISDIYWGSFEGECHCVV